MKRYMAIVEGRSGYVLDFYPEEREKLHRQLTDTIKGEFDTDDEAVKCVLHNLQRAPT